MDYGKSPVPKSPHFEAIMKKYDAVGKYISVRKFWRECVEPLDSNLTLRMWQGFTRKWQEDITDKADRIIKLSHKKELSEMQLERDSLQKLLVIGNASLDDLIERPEILAKIPLRDRMKWLFGAMKSRDSRMNVLIKKKSEERKLSIYEDLMKGAQYGAVDEDDIFEGDCEESGGLIEGREGKEGEEGKEGNDGEKIKFSPDDL